MSTASSQPTARGVLLVPRHHTRQWLTQASDRRCHGEFSVIFFRKKTICDRRGMCAGRLSIDEMCDEMNDDEIDRRRLEIVRARSLHGARRSIQFGDDAVHTIDKRKCG